jgi:arylsulfatase
MGQSLEQASWYKYEFWRYVFVQQEIAKFAETFIAFPPLQKPASFNLDAIKEQVLKAAQSHAGA